MKSLRRIYPLAGVMFMLALMLGIEMPHSKRHDAKQAAPAPMSIIKNDKHTRSGIELGSVNNSFLYQEESNTALREKSLHGFVIPAVYTKVSAAGNDLRSTPFGGARIIDAADVRKNYRWQIIAVFISLGGIVFVGMRLQNENVKLASEKRMVHLQMQLLQERAFRWESAIEGSGDGLWDWDIKKNTMYVSKRWKELLAYTEHEACNMYEEWGARIHPDDKNDVLAILHSYLDGKIPAYISEYRVRCKDGSWKWMLDRGQLVSRSEDGKPLRMIGTYTDITARHLIEEQVRQLAFYDTLTNLPNRRLLSDRLKQTIAAGNRSGCYSAVMFLDLDNFKSLNDTYGHVVGDLLLVEAAARLSNCVRGIDTVARFGGDEFVVMISELDADESESVAQAGIVAEKIRATLAEPYVLNIRQEGKADFTVMHKCSISIGVAVFIKHAGCQDDILKWADTALYQAKEAGRNQIRFYVHEPDLSSIRIAGKSLDCGNIYAVH